MKNIKSTARWTSICILLLVAVFVFIPACASQAPAPKSTPTPASPPPVAKTIELKLIHSQASTHFYNNVVTEWAKRVGEQTKGAVKVTVYPEGTLSKAADIYTSVLKGIAEVGWTPQNYTMDRHPLACLTTQAMLGVDSPSDKVLMREQLEKKFKALTDETKDVHVLWLGSNSGGVIHTKTPCRTLADFKGMEVRCSAGNIDVLKTLGVVPVTIGMPETYLALEKGIVQGVSSANEALLAYKLAEVTKYTTDLKLYSTPNVAFMSLKVWDSLSPDAQKAVTEASAWANKRASDYWIEDDVKGIEFAKKIGHEFIYPELKDAKVIIDAVKQIPDKWAKELDAKGLPATEILKETYRLVDEYLSKKK